MFHLKNYFYQKIFSKKEKIFFLQQGTEKKKFKRKRAHKYWKIVCACTDSGFKRRSFKEYDKDFKSGF